MKPQPRSGRSQGRRPSRGRVWLNQWNSNQGASKRPDAQPGVEWHIAMRPGKRRALDRTRPVDALVDEIEHLKAGVRAKVEHPFRVVKRQFGHVKVRYRGLKKNTAQLLTLFALSNLWMARRALQVLDGQVRQKSANAA